MKTILKRYKSLRSKKTFIINTAISLILVVVGIFATYYANSYTTFHASNPVTDVLLDNLPVVNVDFIYSEGILVFLFIILLALLWEPARIPFALKTMALFLITRSIFMTLTHIAPPTHSSYLDPGDFMRKISSGDDLFFSGHTGVPYLMALLFWDKKIWRYFFLFFTAIGASAAILGHLHYSIDVFSAFFITFGIFYITKVLFLKDYKNCFEEELKLEAK